MSYAEDRRHLWATAAMLEAKATATEESLHYHREQIRNGENEAKQFRERAEHLKSAAETLGAMDRTGLMIEKTPVNRTKEMTEATDALRQVRPC